jgi:predicted DNA binding protein
MTGALIDLIVQDREGPLQTAVTEYESVEIELQPAAADEGTVAPIVRIQGPAASVEAVEAAFEADPAIRSSQRLSADTDAESANHTGQSTEQRRYYIEWSDERSVLGQLVEQEGTVVSARLDGDGWHLQLVFPTRGGLSTAYDAWDTDRWTITIERIVSCEDQPLETHGLTDTQHRALKRAVELGYYEIPRRITLEELAADLEISHQALSECLRRANRTLVTNTVCDPDEPKDQAAETTPPVQIIE